jgi:hypothetical protein
MSFLNVFIAAGKVFSALPPRERAYVELMPLDDRSPAGIRNSPLADPRRGCWEANGISYEQPHARPSDSGGHSATYRGPVSARARKYSWLNERGDLGGFQNTRNRCGAAKEVEPAVVGSPRVKSNRDRWREC